MCLCDHFWQESDTSYKFKICGFVGFYRPLFSSCKLKSPLHVRLLLVAVHIKELSQTGMLRAQKSTNADVVITSAGSRRFLAWLQLGGTDILLILLGVKKYISL